MEAASVLEVNLLKFTFLFFHLAYNKSIVQIILYNYNTIKNNYIYSTFIN